MSIVFWGSSTHLAVPVQDHTLPAKLVRFDVVARDRPVMLGLIVQVIEQRLANLSSFQKDNQAVRGV
jgi:hypothetical protein